MTTSSTAPRIATRMRGNQSAAGVDAQHAQHPAAEYGAGDAEQNVNNHAVARAFHDLARSPARDQSHQNDVDQTAAHEHRCLQIRRGSVCPGGPPVKPGPDARPA